MSDLATDGLRLAALKWLAKIRDDGYPRRRFWAEASPQLRVLVSQRIDGHA